MADKLKFTTRTLFVITASVAVLLACILWATKSYRVRKAAEYRLRSHGADYAYVGENGASSVVFSKPLAHQNLGELKSINRLELQGFVVDHGTLEKVSRLERIDSLMFQSCRLADTADLLELKNISAIKSLHFWNTPISDEAIDVLSELPGVENLTFVNTPITNNGLSRLKELNPRLNVKSRP